MIIILSKGDTHPNMILSTKSLHAHFDRMKNFDGTYNVLIKPDSSYDLDEATPLVFGLTEDAVNFIVKRANDKKNSRCVAFASDHSFRFQEIKDGELDRNIIINDIASLDQISMITIYDKEAPDAITFDYATLSDMAYDNHNIIPKYYSSTKEAYEKFDYLVKVISNKNNYIKDNAYDIHINI